MLERANEGIKALLQRIAKLGEARLRISASLDACTISREVVDSARALTETRCGAIATVGESGRALDFVTSGLTEEKHRQLVNWPDGLHLFKQLRDPPGMSRSSASSPV